MLPQKSKDLLRVKITQQSGPSYHQFLLKKEGLQGKGVLRHGGSTIPLPTS